MKKLNRLAVECQSIGLAVKLCAGNDNRHQQVDQDAGHAARYQGDEKRQAEPKRADAEKFCQTAAYAKEDPVTAGTAKWWSLSSHNFSISCANHCFLNIYGRDQK